MKYLTNILVALLGIVESVLNLFGSFVGIYPIVDLVMSFQVWKEIYSITQQEREMQDNHKENVEKLKKKAYETEIE